MRGHFQTATKQTESVQLDFYGAFYFPTDTVVAAGAYYKICANQIGSNKGQLRFPRRLPMPRISPWRRKRQIAAYLTVTLGGFRQSDVAHYLNISRNSVWHGCRTIEKWRDDAIFRAWLQRLENLVEQEALS